MVILVYIRDMDIKTYIQRASLEQRKLFAARAGSSVSSIANLAYCNRRVSSLDFAIRLIEASHGDITLPELRPDLFPRGKVGKQRAALLIKSLAS